MVKSQTIKGVLLNFLGTFTSRNNDLQGYWILGLLIGSAEQITFDLLEPVPASTEASPLTAAKHNAAKMFSEQLEKAGLSISNLRNAHLDILRSPEAKHGTVNGRACLGYEVAFTARATSIKLELFECAVSLFIAPHDADIELRSARADNKE